MLYSSKSACGAEGTARNCLVLHKKNLEMTCWCCGYYPDDNNNTNNNNNNTNNKTNNDNTNNNNINTQPLTGSFPFPSTNSRDQFISTEDINMNSNNN